MPRQSRPVTTAELVEVDDRLNYRRLGAHKYKVRRRFFGEPLSISPIDAVMECIYIAAGEVKYCTDLLAEISADDIADHTIGGWTLVGMRAAAMERLVKFSKIALDANVDLRRLQLDEAMVSAFVTELADAAEEAGLDDKQKRALGAALRERMAALMPSDTQPDERSDHRSSDPSHPRQSRKRRA